MLTDPVVRKSIYASIIASIIVIIFIQPLLSTSARVITWLGNNLYEGISNGIYSDAAIGLREKFSFSLYLIFWTMINGTVIVPTIILIKSVKKLRNDKEDIKTVEFYKNKLSRLLKTIILMAFIIFIDTFYLVSINYASFQINTSFNQRLTVLAPVLSDNEIKKLRARWGSMQNRNDYDTIINDMQQIANNNKIKLPKLLWK